MTLENAKDILNKNNIIFEMCEYENGIEFLNHIMMFPVTKHAVKQV